LNFGMLGDIVEVINHAEFVTVASYGFRSSDTVPPVLPLSIGLGGRPYNSVSTRPTMHTLMIIVIVVVIIITSCIIYELHSMRLSVKLRLRLSYLYFLLAHLQIV